VVTCAQILLAFTADLLCGDPQWLPHPIRFIGLIAGAAEKACRKIGSTPSVMLALGFLVAVAIPTGAAISTWLLLKEISRLSSWAEWCVAVSIVYTTLSVRGLDEAAESVIKLLKQGKIVEARAALAMIVGRDTETLDEPEVVRATIETVAENTSDGVVAPLFYLMIGGVPAAIAYKAVNTLDSMFGYKNERYLYFGRVSARLDDAANYVPARLTACLVTISAFLLGLSWRHAISVILRDARSQPSPNAGYPEAAYAGALGIRLGGRNTYGGQISQKAYIGDPGRDLNVKLQPETRRLLYVTSLLAVGVCAAITPIFHGIPWR
jgi:adenosylcobinamide-phosphate synthase